MNELEKAQQVRRNSETYRARVILKTFSGLGYR
jgi:hypothetical protein